MNAPAVILINPKYSHNVGAAIRACSCFDVSTLIWTGSRVNPKEYTRLPREERMKGYRDVGWNNIANPFDLAWPCESVPICVEIQPGSMPLPLLEHPRLALYVFGPEDGGVSQTIRRFCHYFVHIPSRHCLNLSAAVNVVLYDRAIKLGSAFDVGCVEHRGEISVAGWNGQ